MQQEQTEGHLKIHVGTNMQRCDQVRLDAATNGLLAIYQEFGIQSVKIVLPLVDVKSLKGREHTIYLRQQSSLQSERFLQRVEAKLAELSVPASESDSASKPIKNSLYITYRNERARVLQTVKHPNQEELERAVIVEASYRHYLHGNSIVVLGDEVLFLQGGKLVIKGSGLLKKTRAEMEGEDIGITFLPEPTLGSAGGCESFQVQGT